MEKLIKTCLFRSGVSLGVVHRVFRPAGFLFWMLETARWIKNHSSDSAPAFVDRYALYSYLISILGVDKGFDYLEFGVAQGTSLRYWLEHCRSNKSRFFGFDTFEGLPEDWGDIRKGSYSNRGSPPELQDQRLLLVKGMFQQTLPGFIGATKLQKPLIIHLDADLYSSTQHVLGQLNPVLSPGDYVLFDEFACIRKSTHEFRAFSESPLADRVKLVAGTQNHQQVILQIDR